AAFRALVRGSLRSARRQATAARRRPLGLPPASATPARRRADRLVAQVLDRRRLGFQTRRAAALVRGLERIERAEAAHAEEVAALLVVEVVVERALLTVLPQQADEAGAAGHDRGPLLDHRTFAPLLVPDVGHAVAEAKVEALTCRRVLHRRADLSLPSGD